MNGSSDSSESHHRIRALPRSDDHRAALACRDRIAAVYPPFDGMDAWTMVTNEWGIGSAACGNLHDGWIKSIPKMCHA